MGRGKQSNVILPGLDVDSAAEKDNFNVIQQIFGREAQQINPLLIGATLLPNQNNQPNRHSLWQ